MIRDKDSCVKARPQVSRSDNIKDSCLQTKSGLSLWVETAATSYELRLPCPALLTIVYIPDTFDRYVGNRLLKKRLSSQTSAPIILKSSIKLTLSTFHEKIFKVI